MRVLSICSLFAAVAVALAADVVPRGESARRVEVRDLTFDGTRVSGLLVNRTVEEVSDVRLLVSERFLWKDEMHPGPNDPSRAMTFTVPGPLAPGGTLPFEQPMPPRPARTDGRFVLDISVLGLAQRPIVPGS
jgi:hypothetical protein